MWWVLTEYINIHICVLKHIGGLFLICSNFRQTKKNEILSSDRGNAWSCYSMAISSLSRCDFSTLCNPTMCHSFLHATPLIWVCTCVNGSGSGIHTIAAGESCAARHFWRGRHNFHGDASAYRRTTRSRQCGLFIEVYSQTFIDHVTFYAIVQITMTLPKVQIKSSKKKFDKKNTTILSSSIEVSLLTIPVVVI